MNLGGFTNSLSSIPSKKPFFDKMVLDLS
jgi:hypothetical protein